MSRFLSPLTEPVGALWALMVLEFVWLLCRRQWRSAFWLSLPILLLFVLGSTPLPEILVAREERQWAEDYWAMGPLTTDTGRQISDTEPMKYGNTEAPAHHLTETSVPYAAVVTLGGGERVSQHDLLGFAEGDGGSRLLTAIQLARSGKAKTLVLGGSCDSPPNQPNVPSMKVVQDWVADWGVVSGHVVTNLGFCRNTHDEAVAFRKLAQNQGWTNAILVTSAIHLRRALALFKKQGLDVTPVAADFQVYGVPQVSSSSPFPHVNRLFLLALYMHEKIGWWVYRARGWV
jgi:uncharacterized SAM-binding protein YcdF (DUF218 family)